MDYKMKEDEKKKKGRKVKHEFPFDKLEIGQRFFVPDGVFGDRYPKTTYEKMREIASNRMRRGAERFEKVTFRRYYLRDAAGKIVRNKWGEKVKGEPVEYRHQKYVYSKRFFVYEGTKEIGGQPVKGVYVIRTNPTKENDGGQ